MDSRHERSPLRAIFESAHELPPSERQAYLHSACRGNMTMLLEVQRLLEINSQTSHSFLAITDAANAQSASGAILTPGTLVGPFRVMQQIGRGGMGEVYLASRSSDYHTDVAIKVARQVSPDILSRFSRERQILASLDHPNVCRILDGGSLPNDGRPYLVMEYVKGAYLHEYCERNQLGYRERARLIVSVCHAVEACHDKGVVHRDLSPNNVLVTESGMAKVMDFGIAALTKPIHDAHFTNEPLTSQIGVGVTIPYASPEQVFYDQSRPIDERSDVYMLGALMYRVFCGQPPFDGLARDAQIEAIRMQDPLPPRKVQRNLPFDLETVCVKCLDKSPTRRYPSVQAVTEDLERFLRNEPVLARRASRLERTSRWCQRNPVLAGVISVLVLVTCLGTAGVAASLSRARTFQANSQKILGSLTTSLQESYFLKPSAYEFSTDYRDALAQEFLTYAQDTLSSVRETATTRPLLAGMHAELGRTAMNAGDKASGESHYKESLRLWRAALHDDRDSKTNARAFALTLSAYADALGNGVMPFADLENNGALAGFSYTDPIDRVLADEVADFWIRRGKAFREGSGHAPILDAVGAAVQISQQLSKAEPKNAEFIRSLAIAHLTHGDALGQWGQNAAATRDAYQAAVDAVQELESLTELTVADVREESRATWQIARITARHTDWQQGVKMYEKALELAQASEKKSAGTIDDIRLQTDILWSAFQNLPPAVPVAVREDFAVKLRLHFRAMSTRELTTGNDIGRWGAIQLFLARTLRERKDLAAAEYLFVRAPVNLKLGFENDPVDANLWYTQYIEACIELGDLNSTTLPKSPADYYREAEQAAKEFIAKKPDIPRVIELADSARQKLSAIANESGQK